MNLMPWYESLSRVDKITVLGVFATITGTIMAIIQYISKSTPTTNNTTTVETNSGKIISGNTINGDFNDNSTTNNDNGTTINNYGVSDAVLLTLTKIIDEKNIALSEKDSLLRELTKKYNELDARLKKRPLDDSLAKEARKNLKADNLKEAEKLLIKSLENNLKIISTKKLSAADDAFEIASLKELQLDYPGARKYYKQAVELSPENTQYITDYGNILDTLGEYDKAIEYHEKALDIDKTNLGEDHPSVAISYTNLGVAWKNKGEYDKAIWYHEKALNIDKTNLGENHPRVAASYTNLGNAWDSKGEYDKAIEYHEKALNIDKNKLEKDHPDVAMDYGNLGAVWDSKGEYDKTIEYFEKALAIFTSKLGNNHPYTKQTENNLKIAIQKKQQSY